MTLEEYVAQLKSEPKHLGLVSRSRIVEELEQVLEAAKKEGQSQSRGKKEAKDPE